MEVPSVSHVALKIALQGTDISRTVVVPGDWKMKALHKVIQAALGWEGEHLWSFEYGKTLSIMPDDWEPPFDGLALFSLFREPHQYKPAERLTIRECLPEKGAKLEYRYDSWKHRITRMTDPKVAEVACVRTQGLMPTEDINGPYALMRLAYLLKAYDANPKVELDATDAELLDWYGSYKEERVRKAFLRAPTKEDITERLRAAVGR